MIYESKSKLFVFIYRGMTDELVDRDLEEIRKNAKSFYAWLASAVLIMRNGALRYSKQFCKDGLRYFFKFSENT